MKTLKISEAPKEVQEAFEHVKSFFPTLSIVEYDGQCLWDYQGLKEEVFDFHNVDIDINILHDAADAQYKVGSPVRYII